MVQHIESKGVQTRMLFAGNLTRHPCFDEMRKSRRVQNCGGLEETDIIMSNSFWVGIYPGMSDEMIDYIAQAIRNLFIEASFFKTPVSE